MFEATITLRDWLLDSDDATSFWNQVCGNLSSVEDISNVDIEGNLRQGPVRITAMVSSAPSSAKAKSRIYDLTVWAVESAGGKLRRATEPVPGSGFRSVQFSAVSAKRQ